MTSRQQICILGGGFGGLYTALRLSKLPWPKAEIPEIVLVDQQDRFLFSPLLYELVTGELQTWEVAPPYEELLANTGIRFHQSSVSAIDLEGRQVTLGDGATLAYDRLVLALGGETPMDWVPGVAEHALAFRSLDDANRLRERLRILEASEAEKIRVAVIGGGYSGVELACKLAERLGSRGRLRLVEQATEILRTSPEHNRQVALQALSDQGVWLDLETTVESVTENSLSLKYRDQIDIIPVELVLWTVGVKMNPAVEALSLKRSDRNRIAITSTLQAIDHPEVFALGDVAECLDAESQQVPASAQAAMQQADYVGWNIWASLTERPLLPFRYQHLGEMMTLGTDKATLTGLGLQLEGEMAHIARRLAYLYRMPTLDHQIRVGLNWISKPLRDILSV
ncbi:NAD(P)/FAD-dependent oxidoreductase [Pseudanabaena sp. FACHB-2040]|uniref:NAD(P)/FAD-dependent oxidoreductase n=1 Tax=Pseudanabaena sp. FACHB-2040 TaxID=2692859 RepID=UPI0016866820|nr:NAD(P)/FAD-dependent oxidoreductase [Pseudanabaena sp. FACHB-2040]MBD0268074.1 NAD(P)/FAD-dependent oxidoreductase [Cyanobacteria bacterium Co-bin8]MBD2260707.1 NAD(P)/FAD-dependent oxidoreductase [Pseudanabaena sp. FACHB-2040]